MIRKILLTATGAVAATAIVGVPAIINKQGNTINAEVSIKNTQKNSATNFNERHLRIASPITASNKVISKQVSALVSYADMMHAFDDVVCADGSKPTIKLSLSNGNNIFYSIRVSNSDQVVSALISDASGHSVARELTIKKGFENINLRVESYQKEMGQLPSNIHLYNSYEFFTASLYVERGTVLTKGELYDLLGIRKSINDEEAAKILLSKQDTIAVGTGWANLPSIRTTGYTAKEGKVFDIRYSLTDIAKPVASNSVIDKSYGSSVTPREVVDSIIDEYDPNDGKTTVSLKLQHLNSWAVNTVDQVIEVVVKDSYDNQIIRTVTIKGQPDPAASILPKIGVSPSNVTHPSIQFRGKATVLNGVSTQEFNANFTIERGTQLNYAAFKRMFIINEMNFPDAKIILSNTDTQKEATNKEFILSTHSGNINRIYHFIYNSIDTIKPTASDNVITKAFGAAVSNAEIANAIDNEVDPNNGIASVVVKDLNHPALFVKSVDQNVAVEVTDTHGNKIEKIVTIKAAINPETSTPPKMGVIPENTFDLSNTPKDAPKIINGITNQTFDTKFTIERGTTISKQQIEAIFGLSGGVWSKNVDNLSNVITHSESTDNDFGTYTITSSSGKKIFIIKYDVKDTIKPQASNVEVIYKYGDHVTDIDIEQAIVDEVDPNGGEAHVKVKFGNPLGFEISSEQKEVMVVISDDYGNEIERIVTLKAALNPSASIIPKAGAKPVNVLSLGTSKFQAPKIIRNVTHQDFKSNFTIERGTALTKQQIEIMFRFTGGKWDGSATDLTSRSTHVEAKGTAFGVYTINTGEYVKNFTVNFDIKDSISPIAVDSSIVSLYNEEINEEKVLHSIKASDPNNGAVTINLKDNHNGFWHVTSRDQNIKVIISDDYGNSIERNVRIRAALNPNENNINPVGVTPSNVLNVTGSDKGAPVNINGHAMQEFKLNLIVERGTALTREQIETMYGFVGGSWIDGRQKISKIDTLRETLNTHFNTYVNNGVKFGKAFAIEYAVKDTLLPSVHPKDIDQKYGTQVTEKMIVDSLGHIEDINGGKISMKIMDRLPIVQDEKQIVHIKLEDGSGNSKVIGINILPKSTVNGIKYTFLIIASVVLAGILTGLGILASKIRKRKKGKKW